MPSSPDDTPEMRQHQGYALHILSCASQHAAGFQLHRYQIKNETGLSERKLAAGLRVLQAAGFMTRVAIRNQSKLDGWCYRVNLDGKADKPKGWVLHYNQTEDRDFRVTTHKRKNMRRKAARLPTSKRNKEAKDVQVDSFRAVARRTSNSSRLSVIPCTPYNGTNGTCGPVDLKREYPLTPLAGGNLPPVSPEVEELAMGIQNRETRVEQALGELSKSMSDQAITRWWNLNLPGRMLDSTLPAGQSFTAAEKRTHVRRLRRDPAYLHCIVRHWLKTRLAVSRMDHTVVTTTLKHRYDLRDTHDSLMDNYSLVQAYRQFRAANGQEWNQRNPQFLHHAFGVDTLGSHVLPGSDAVTGMLAGLGSLLRTTQRALQENELVGCTVFDYFALRLWAVEHQNVSGDCLRQMDQAGLRPSGCASLAQWAILYGPGRCLFGQAKKRLTDAQLVQVFGLTSSDWLTHVGDHVVHSQLVEEQHRCLDYNLKRKHDQVIV